MSLRREVMRRYCRRQRSGFKVAWASFGPPAARDGWLRVYGKRLDFLKVRAYLWHLDGTSMEQARRWSKPERLDYGGVARYSPRRRLLFGCFRPWAGE